MAKLVAMAARVWLAGMALMPWAMMVWQVLPVMARVAIKRVTVLR